MNRDIIKVGFAILAAVTTYNFADMVINAQENDTQPIVDVNVTNNNNVYFYTKKCKMGVFLLK